MLGSFEKLNVVEVGFCLAGIFCHFFAVVSERVAHTTLALIIKSKTVNFALVVKSDRVVFASISTHDTNIFKLLDEGRQMGIGKCSNTELSKAVLAPGVQLPFCVDKKRVILACKDVFGLLDTERGNPHSLLVSVTGLDNAANFSVVITAPGKDFSVLSQC